MEQKILHYYYQFPLQVIITNIFHTYYCNALINFVIKINEAEAIAESLFSGDSWTMCGREQGSSHPSPFHQAQMEPPSQSSLSFILCSSVNTVHLAFGIRHVGVREGIENLVPYSLPPNTGRAVFLGLPQHSSFPSHQSSFP